MNKVMIMEKKIYRTEISWAKVWIGSGQALENQTLVYSFVDLAPHISSVQDKSF